MKSWFEDSRTTKRPFNIGLVSNESVSFETELPNLCVCPRVVLAIGTHNVPSGKFCAEVWVEAPEDLYTVRFSGRNSEVTVICFIDAGTQCATFTQVGVGPRVKGGSESIPQEQIQWQTILDVLEVDLDAGVTVHAFNECGTVEINKGQVGQVDVEFSSCEDSDGEGPRPADESGEAFEQRSKVRNERGVFVKSCPSRRFRNALQFGPDIGARGSATIKSVEVVGAFAPWPWRWLVQKSKLVDSEGDGTFCVRDDECKAVGRCPRQGRNASPTCCCDCAMMPVFLSWAA